MMSTFLNLLLELHWLGTSCRMHMLLGMCEFLKKKKKKNTANCAKGTCLPDGKDLEASFIDVVKKQIWLLMHSQKIGAVYHSFSTIY